MKTIRVGLDLSMLGLSWARPELRRGIDRVIEKLVVGLAGREDCELIPTAMMFRRETQDYLKHTLPGRALAPPSHALQEPVSALIAAGHRFIYGSASNRSPLHRALRRATAVGSALAAPLERHISTQLLGSLDLFHSPYLPFPPAVGRRRELPKFITIYDLIPLTHPHFIPHGHDRWFRAALACLEFRPGIICISHYVKETICQRLRVEAERVFVTHLAAAPETFHPMVDSAAGADVRRRYRLPERYFLSLSVLDPRKNLSLLIRAFVELIESEKIDEIGLVLVGHCPPEHEKDLLGGLLAAHRARIFFTGFIPDKDLAAVYSGARAFVFPSIVEGFGLPPLEAMQCGVPVICSNSSSLPEVVGDAGILFDPLDLEQLCSAMLEVHQDEELRARLAGQALARSQQFTWDRYVDHTVNAYQTAIATI